MSLSRGGFLRSLFISPAVAKERLYAMQNEQKQKLEDERIRQVVKAQAAGLKPQDIKPRCNTCDQVLIGGKCQFTRKCNYCTGKRHREMERHPNRQVYIENGVEYTALELYNGAVDVFTHVVEEKCIVCGNAPEIVMGATPFNYPNGPVSYAVTCTYADPNYTWNGQPVEIGSPSRKRFRSL